ncbi:transcriptional repressor [Candidatus Poribacteria bacterium]|nr:transcriptional repressor [Candidatus Poribacteria bacterium]
MCAERVENLSKELRQEGYRFTRQRQLILEEVRKLKCHPRARDIYDAVKQRMPNVSLGTVYRSLGILADLGLIRKLEYDDSSRFDANLSDHYHLICADCDQLFDVDTSVLERLNTQGLEANGFDVNGHKLELYGLCPNCNQEKQGIAGESQRLSV